MARTSTIVPRDCFASRQTYTGCQHLRHTRPHLRVASIACLRRCFGTTTFETRAVDSAQRVAIAAYASGRTPGGGSVPATTVASVDALDRAVQQTLDEFNAQWPGPGNFRKREARRLKLGKEVCSMPVPSACAPSRWQARPARALCSGAPLAARPAAVLLVRPLQICNTRADGLVRRLGLRRDPSLRQAVHDGAPRAAHGRGGPAQRSVWLYAQRCNLARPLRCLLCKGGYAFSSPSAHEHAPLLRDQPASAPQHDEDRRGRVAARQHARVPGTWAARC